MLGFQVSGFDRELESLLSTLIFDKFMLWCPYYDGSEFMHAISLGLTILKPQKCGISPGFGNEITCQTEHWD